MNFWLTCVSSLCLKVLKTLQTQKSPNEQHKIGQQCGADFARELWYTSLLFVIQLDHLSWANSDHGACSQNYRFYALYRSHLGQMTHLNKKYSRYEWWHWSRMPFTSAWLRECDPFMQTETLSGTNKDQVKLYLSNTQHINTKQVYS